MNISSAFKGPGGEYDVQRLLGALGTVIYAVTAPALVWAGVVSVSFDTFCIMYPTGLAACVGATAGSIALKDRQVAKAQREGK